MNILIFKYYIVFNSIHNTIECKQFCFHHFINFCLRGTTKDRHKIVQFRILLF